ncbi:hypothetical protein PoB_004534600 [Plakobranchus ocellatus]|uniref:BESS domain-containing protein n=1 Tax=Plakobranchus ocellatus TaxID=259542 RepID=A0AAV4BIS5_9GAST|nr:hypothetical protein PoB_004534600 [Plakobranchus ocellatus]
MLDTITSICDKLTLKEAPDEDELFCKSLVSKIRSLDPFSKMECQAEIQMVILKYMKRSTQVADSSRQFHTSPSGQTCDYQQYQYQTYDSDIHPM